jgi:hypothetical protein
MSATLLAKESSVGNQIFVQVIVRTCPHKIKPITVFAKVEKASIKF